MTLYKSLFIPFLLGSGVFNSYAGEAENNITHDYLMSWKRVANGEITPGVLSATLEPDVVKDCKSSAPAQFRREIIRQWSYKTGTQVTDTAFLSEDLQMFDRLGTLSCLEGAEYELKGYGDRLIEALGMQLHDIEAKNGNDAWEQIKTLEFQAGIITARYGVNSEKQKLNRQK
ncbi:hypothetical protein [Buttiauxella agrestis]|uniref:hypothetical protein n=1 Tax=Buttiauxella agrestis TaxID=82977 RepID=UPI001560459F|nr:hypothetical protein [Buttiauxella agrestis]BCG08942.1 hypothetical protein BADSM9389_16050 [Buttiauxella agrestis]